MSRDSLYFANPMGRSPNTGSRTCSTVRRGSVDFRPFDGSDQILRAAVFGNPRDLRQLAVGPNRKRRLELVMRGVGSPRLVLTGQNQGVVGPRRLQRIASVRSERRAKHPANTVLLLVPPKHQEVVGLGSLRPIALRENHFAGLQGPEFLTFTVLRGAHILDGLFAHGDLPGSGKDPGERFKCAGSRVSRGAIA